MPKLPKKIKEIPQKLKEIPEKVKKAFTKSDLEKAEAKGKEARKALASLQKLQQKVDVIMPVPDDDVNKPKYVSQYIDKITKLRENFRTKTIDTGAITIADNEITIVNADTVLAEASTMLKSLKKYAKKIEAERAVYDSFGKDAADAGAIRTQLEKQYLKNKEILESQSYDEDHGVDERNPLLVLAQKKIEGIVNGLARSTGDETAALRQMATLIILSSENEIRKIKAGKDKDTPDETAAQRLKRRKDSLEEGLDTIEEDLKTKNDGFSAKVLDPAAEGPEEDELEEVVLNDDNLEEFTTYQTEHKQRQERDARYARNIGNVLKFDDELKRFADPSLVAKSEFKNLDVVHNKFAQFEKDVKETADILKSLYLVENLNREQRAALKEQEIRAEMFQERLELYRQYLNSYPYHAAGAHDRLNHVEELRTKLNDAKSFQGSVGYTGERIEIIPIADLGARLAADNPDTTRGISTSDKNIKAGANFKPATEARVIHHHLLVKNPVDNGGQSKIDLITVERNIGNRFFSQLAFTRNELEKLTEDEQFKIAIRVADNFLRKVKNNAPVEFSGDWPKSFVQNVVDYMVLNNVYVDTKCHDSKKWGKDKSLDVTPGMFSKRSMASKLESGKMRTEIFGTDTPLAFTTSKKDSDYKETKATKEDLRTFTANNRRHP